MQHTGQAIALSTGNPNPGGMTPTTVWRTPSMATARPMTSRAEAKRERQRIAEQHDRIAVGQKVVRHQLSRLRLARTPSAANRPSDAKPPVTACASLSPVR